MLEFDHRFLTYSGTHFPLFWEPLGIHLGVLGDHLGGLERSVGSLVPSLGASLGHLGPSWVPLGSLLATLWPILVPPGSFWTPPSLILEPLGTNFGAQWGVFWGVFWAYSFPRIPALLVAKYPGELVRLLGGPKTIHHLAGVKKLQTINENLSSRTDQKGSKQTYLRSMQPSSQTVI